MSKKIFDKLTIFVSFTLTYVMVYLLYSVLDSADHLKYESAMFDDSVALSFLNSGAYLYYGLTQLISEHNYKLYGYIYAFVITLVLFCSAIFINKSVRIVYLSMLPLAVGFFFFFYPAPLNFYLSVERQSLAMLLAYALYLTQGVFSLLVFCLIFISHIGFSVVLSVFFFYRLFRVRLMNLSIRALFLLSSLLFLGYFLMLDSIDHYISSSSSINFLEVSITFFMIAFVFSFRGVLIRGAEFFLLLTLLFQIAIPAVGERFFDTFYFYFPLIFLSGILWRIAR